MFFQQTLTSKTIADVRFAHQLTRRLAAVRQQGIMQGLYPVGKAQVALEYDNDTPITIANLVISTPHAPSLSLRDLRDQLIEYVMKPVIPDRIRSHQVMDRERDRRDSTVMFVNPTGAFLFGGLKADAGLTGRKIIVDTLCALRPLLNASTGSDRSTGRRLPRDIWVARNSPGKPQTVS